MPRKIFLATFLIILSLVFVGLIKQISEALNAGDRLDLAIEEVERLKHENKRLQNKLSEIQEYNYIEEVSRNKLNMSKSNETIVIVPQEAVANILTSQRVVEEPKLPNWQGWLRLFIH
jgi:cell division protein FtsB